MSGRLITYLQQIARRGRLNAEIGDELSFHLEQEIQEHLARGLSPAEARRIALRDLGGLTQTREAMREVRTTWLDAWGRDIRHAVRSLRATPSFTLVAVCVLTLGIGATTAIYSVVDAVILRGLPFPEADRVVAVGELVVRGGSDGANNVAPQNFLDWRARQDVFTGLAAINDAGFILKAEGRNEPEILVSQMVTADFFPVLGVKPLIGRTFTVENEVDGNARVAVISYSLWQRRFGGSPGVVGRHLPGILADLEILGVMPPTFAYPVGATRPAELWTPYVVPLYERVRGNTFGYYLQVIGRLRPGVSLELAQVRMNQITAQLAAETPRWFTDRVANVEGLADHLTKQVRRWMFMILGAVAFVLLIACVNLSNLTLARVSKRSRELSIRSALGASRWDLARGLMVESLMLSLLGAAFGVIVAWWSLSLLRTVIPAELPRVATIAIDARVLAAAVIMAVTAGLAFSVVPVLQFSRPSAGTALSQAGRLSTASPSHHWLRAALVVAEVALAVVLLVGSGLFLASFARVTSVNLGFDYHDVLTVRVRPLLYPSEAAAAQQRNPPLLQNVLERVRAIPGVEVGALVGPGDMVPLSGNLITVDFGVPGRQVSPDDIALSAITPDYFRAIRMRLVRGRVFADDDRQGSELVAILNDAAAKHYFPGEDPIGKTVYLRGTRTVVGIVGDTRYDGPESDSRRQAFVPFGQSAFPGATLVLRVSRDPRVVLPAVKTAIWSQFPGVPIPDIQTLEQLMNGLIAQRRFNMLLLGLFGLLGIVIALVGIYGVIAYVVEQRTQEFGIRMALGAAPAAILRSVLGRASAQLVIGLSFGLAGAWGLSRLVSAFLFETPAHDALVYTSVGVALVATGLAAAFIPARRAARVDPLVALRTE